MKLERSINKILLDIFKYLKSIHLLQAFSNLNSRFNNLLIIHFRTHGLDLRSISKHEFDTLCQQNLPSIAKHITGLRLSDDDDTPNQINLFLSESSTLRQFVQLKKLSLYHISSYATIQKVVVQLRYLPLLTHFDLINCHLKFHQKTLHEILNRIWLLLELKHVHLDLNFVNANEFTTPTIRSKCIEYLIIENSSLNSIQLIRLFRCTPQLRHLTIIIDQLSNDTEFPSKIESISSLKLVVDHLTNGTITLLKNVPNLTSLTLQIENNHMNGHQWKQLIIDYLPKLKIFQFVMLCNVNNEDEMNEMFDSYRTSFWVTERQWYIRCHWKSENNEIAILLYTLPYALQIYNCLFENANGHTKSTCPKEDNYCSYKRVTKLLQHCPISNDWFLSHIRFYNIRHLELTLPVADQNLSTLPRLDRLISLDISSDADADGTIVLSQLQSIINQASRLQYLIIGHWESSSVQQLLLHITSDSIRRLDLQSYHYAKRDRCFNIEQCKTFLSTPLAKQCQVLQIVVNDKLSTNELINGMPNLQALKVVFQPSDRNNHYPGRRVMIRWLASGFSRTVTENLIGTETSRFWIR